MNQDARDALTRWQAGAGTAEQLVAHHCRCTTTRPKRCDLCIRIESILAVKAEALVVAGEAGGTAPAYELPVHRVAADPR